MLPTNKTAIPCKNRHVRTGYVIDVADLNIGNTYNIVNTLFSYNKTFKIKKFVNKQQLPDVHRTKWKLHDATDNELGTK